MILKLKILIKRLVKFLSNEVKNYSIENKIISRDQIDYFLSIQNIFLEIKDVPGDIIELGVGRGRNSIIFGSLIEKNHLGKFKKYYGFDTFGQLPSRELENNPKLKKLLSKEDSFDYIRDLVLSNNLSDQVKLIKGDIVENVGKIENNKLEILKKDNLYISLMYIDCNHYIPSLTALKCFKNNFSKGALIVVDESRIGGENKALKQFCNENNLTMKTGKFGNHNSSYTKI